MKKIILSILGLIIAASTSFGQDIKLGIKAGANFSQLKSDEQWLDSDNNTGYIIGAWGRVGAGVIHFQPEVYFTSKNTTVKGQAPGGAAEDLMTGDLKFSNIDIPLLIGTNFPLGPIKGRIQAGPLFSFVIDKNASYSASASETFKNALEDYKNNFAAVVGGLGLDIGKFTIDARYEYGLGNITKYEGEKQTLNIWTVSLGFNLL
ncbi:PorT family protein [Sphingobacterium sp. SGG-5]|uniref:porin family protein n=1 Tax=Sphingobacterium sp. SGG-5 TaxID=2710881 RepID=UPI0013ED5F87|nr:porin family protein [Sphingobacterium sp. SGG-5]NGM63112.1 PorT family protein [Sphingobacterium sp. SGG-5]